MHTNVLSALAGGLEADAALKYVLMGDIFNFTLNQ